MLNGDCNLSASPESVVMPIKFCTFTSLTVFAVASIALEPAAAQNKPDHSRIWGPMFLGQVTRCWHKPAPAGETAADMKAVFRIKLNQDGRLSEEPSLADPAQSGYVRSYQQSAVRAINLCQPYKLPIEYYEEWKDFEPVFSERPGSPNAKRKPEDSGKPVVESLDTRKLSICRGC